MLSPNGEQINWATVSKFGPTTKLLNILTINGIYLDDKSDGWNSFLNTTLL